MEKNYGNELTAVERENVTKQRQILFQNNEYMKKLEEKYEINEDLFYNMQLTNLSEFLSHENDKYKKFNYITNKDLQRVLVLIDEEKQKAIMMNISIDEKDKEDSKLPQGEFGVYDLQTQKFEISNQIKEQIIEKLGISGLDLKKQDEIINSIFEKDELDKMDKLATINLDKIIEPKKEKIKQTIDEKIDESNHENGKTTDERKNVEKEVNKDKDKKQKEEVKNSKLPKHIVEYCIMAGIAVPKAAIDTKADEAAKKIDEPHINKNGGNVTIIRTRDDSKSTDKYLVFQDGKMIIPGNRDDKIDKVVGKTMQHSKDGTMIKPLEIDDEEQYFEYEDRHGTVIREKLEEQTNLSIDDLEEFKKAAKKELEKFSQELDKIDNTPFVSDEDKDRLRSEANERFNINNKELAQKYNINYNNMKDINLETDKTTQKEIDKEDEIDKDEIEAWEVPGKRDRER